MDAFSPEKESLDELFQDFGLKTNIEHIKIKYATLATKKYQSFNEKVTSYWDFVEKNFEALPSQKKSNDFSREARAEGNQHFKLKNNEDALKLYCFAIGLAENSSAELSIAYANRSAVNFEFKRYEDVITDVDRALAGKYPENKKFKILKRKASCLVQLQRFSEATAAYKGALGSLDVSDLKESQFEEEKKLINCEIAKLKNRKDIAKKDNKTFPKLTDPPSDTIYCASEAVKVDLSPSFGRMVVATKDIQPGDILSIEKAYVSTARFVLKFCYYCKKECFSMVSCLSCTQVFYCDENCRVKSWDTEHMIECDMMPTIHAVSNSCLPIACAIKVLLKMTKQGRKLQKFVDNRDKYRESSPLPGFKNGKYSANKTSIMNLYFKDHLPFLSRFPLYNIKPCLIILALKKTSFFDFIDKENDVYLARLLTEICYQMTSNLQPFFPNQGALLPFSSLINHSCDPNVFQHSCGDDTYFLIAIEPILKGEQICITYGPHVVNMEKKNRHILFKQYGFRCLCCACEENWPPVNVMPMMDMHLIDKSVKKKTIEKYYTEFSNFNSMVRKGNFEFRQSHLNTLFRLAVFFKKYLPKPNPRLLYCKHWIIETIRKLIIDKSFKFK